MQGCIEYNCFSAGQRSYQRVLSDADWHKRPDTARNLFHTYFKLKDLHEIMWLLSRLATLCPDPSLKSKIEDRVAEIDGLWAQSDETIRTLDVSGLYKRDRVWVELVKKAQERYQVRGEALTTIDEVQSLSDRLAKGPIEHKKRESYRDRDL